MIWHSTAEKAPTYWIAARMIDDRIRFTVFEGATDEGTYVDLSLSDALDLANDITKLASL